MKSASLRVVTAFSGLRYYMTEWFWVLMIVFVGSVTTVGCSGVLVAVIMIKRAGWLTFL